MNTYFIAVLNGKFGKIGNKHFELAKILKDFPKDWNVIDEYIRMYKKYDNWTIRDIDKVHAIRTLTAKSLA